MILRFPPSPTGKLTVGNIFILINLLIFNLKYLKYLVLRVDDTDKNRLKLKFVKNILKQTNKIKINYKKIFFQSNKNYYYLEILQFLYKKKKIYLSKNYKINSFYKIYYNLNYNIFIKKKKLIKNFLVKFKNIKIKNYNKIIKNFFILKYDNNFSYNYSSILDDLNSNIKFLIRGLEHNNNIKNQLILIIILKKKKNLKLIHLPLILNNGKKISKRNYINKNKIYYNIIHIYFYKIYSFNDIIVNFNIKKLKFINLNFDIKKFLKIKKIYENLINLNYFNKLKKFTKKIINIKFKNYLNLQNLANLNNFFYLNKINFLNINIIKKIFFKKLFLNKKFFLYIEKILIINKINFNNYNRYKNYKNFKKKYFISIKSLNMLINCLKIKI